MNRLDLGQFGSALIFSPYNYEKGGNRGIEVSSHYHNGGFSTYANFSFISTQAKNIISAQYLFSAEALAYIQNHYIPIDDEGKFTVSSGAAYAWANTKVFADFLYGSGLRNGFANQTHLPGYYPVNLGFEQIFHPRIRNISAVKLRLDITNFFDQVYRLRDGTGISVSASRYGARRGFYAGISVLF
jgi:hypothetical protein